MCATLKCAGRRPKRRVLHLLQIFVHVATIALWMAQDSLLLLPLQCDILLLLSIHCPFFSILSPFPVSSQHSAIPTITTSPRHLPSIVRVPVVELSVVGLSFPVAPNVLHSMLLFCGCFCFFAGTFKYIFCTCVYFSAFRRDVLFFNFFIYERFSYRWFPRHVFLFF